MNYRELSTDVAGQVNIDQVNLATKLLQQGRHHQLVIAPDQHVAPVVAVGALVGGRFVEGQAKLAGLGLARIARLVNGLWSSSGDLGR